MGIPLIVVCSLISGATIYATNLESRLTTHEAKIAYLELGIKETKSLLKLSRADDKEMHLSNQKIFRDLERTLRLIGERLVAVETKVDSK